MTNASRNNENNILIKSGGSVRLPSSLSASVENKLTAESRHYLWHQIYLRLTGNSLGKYHHQRIHYTRQTAKQVVDLHISSYLDQLSPSLSRPVISQYLNSLRQICRPQKLLKFSHITSLLTVYILVLSFHHLALLLLFASRQLMLDRHSWWSVPLYVRSSHVSCVSRLIDCFFLKSYE